MARKTKTVKAWAIYRSDTMYQGTWWRRTSAQAVLDLCPKHGDYRVIPVEIRPLKKPRKPKP